MDIFSNHHQRQLHTNPSSVSDFRVIDVSSPTSGSSCTFTRNTFSDEEIVLASNKPKRRAGRMKFKETRHPIYRGVRQRNNGKWVCEVREPNKKTRIWLGTFPTPEMAARAHDVAVIALRGRSACLNFADSVWRLPIPESLDAKDIRRAATEAAKALHPPELMEESSSMVNSPVNSVENWSEQVFYMDEEAEYGMGGFLADMAEGLLLSPPPLGGFNWDDVESNIDVSLWSYSI